jgi:hypothetical protein
LVQASQPLLLRYPGGKGIGIDHFAALVVDGEDYRVISIAGREGSVEGEQFSPDRQVRDLLSQADGIVEGPRLATARAAGPDGQPDGHDFVALPGGVATVAQAAVAFSLL